MFPFYVYLVGVFLVGLWAVLPPVWLLVRRQLPSNKVYALDVALQDADDVFRSCAEGGLLDGVAAVDLHARLIALHEHAHPLRLRAFQTTTMWGDLMNMRRGLSREMARLIREVRSVRARIAAISYVELQTVQLRTIDGKEVAQLRCELNHECLWAAAPASNSVLFAPAATDDIGIANEADEKVGAPAASMSQHMVYGMSGW